MLAASFDVQAHETRAEEAMPLPLPPSLQPLEALVMGVFKQGLRKEFLRCEVVVADSMSSMSSHQRSSVGTH